MRIVKKKQLAGSLKELEYLNIPIPGKQKKASDCLAGLAFLYPGQRIPESGYLLHPTEEFLYIKSGRILVETQTGSEIAEKGDLIFMPPREPHSNINIADQQAEILWCRSNS
ncbi:MAG: Cupin domain protein [Firmicutes bacterium ADurb.Bin456]|nr:MAG: Cupin domain protein [Firmicutes bacterium ADurb.Bin456]